MSEPITGNNNGSQAKFLLSDSTPPFASTIGEDDAKLAASSYVATFVNSTFEVVSGKLSYHNTRQQHLWQFIIRSTHGPLSIIYVDPQTGMVIPLTKDEIRVIQEKAAIYIARNANVLPLNEAGYVFGKYARRCADKYLNEQIGMFFNAVDPVFVSNEPPRWQVTIVFKRYHCGPFTLGIMDVDAKTGTPIPLNKQQLKRIRQRTNALIQPHRLGRKISSIRCNWSGGDQLFCHTIC